jgi:hypothetical protein
MDKKLVKTPFKKKYRPQRRIETKLHRFASWSQQYTEPQAAPAKVIITQPRQPIVSGYFN